MKQCHGRVNGLVCTILFFRCATTPLVLATADVNKFGSIVGSAACVRPLGLNCAKSTFPVLHCHCLISMSILFFTNFPRVPKHFVSISDVVKYFLTALQGLL